MSSAGERSVRAEALRKNERTGVSSRRNQVYGRPEVAIWNFADRIIHQTENGPENIERNVLRVKDERARSDAGSADTDDLGDVRWNMGHRSVGADSFVACRSDNGHSLPHHLADDAIPRFPERVVLWAEDKAAETEIDHLRPGPVREDRKSTRLNSSHRCISYAVF